MSHQCPRNGCTRTVGDSHLMCGPDWKRVPPALQRAVYTAYGRGAGIGSDELLAAQDAAIRAVNARIEPGPGETQAALFSGQPAEPRPPSPYELWVQAGEDRARYRELMIEHGHLIGPGDPGYDPDPRLPCGWAPGAGKRDGRAGQAG